MNDDLPAIEVCHECMGVYEKHIKFEQCPYCGCLTLRRLRMDARNLKRRENRAAKPTD